MLTSTHWQVCRLSVPLSQSSERTVRMTQTFSLYVPPLAPQTRVASRKPLWRSYTPSLPLKEQLSRPVRWATGPCSCLAGYHLARSPTSKVVLRSPLVAMGRVSSPGHDFPTPQVGPSFSSLFRD